MTIEQHDAPPVEPAPDKPPLRLVKQDEPREPILPGVLRDREALVATSKVVARRGAHKAGQRAWQTPFLLGKLVAWSPRGLYRVSKAVGSWVHDQDTADLRHQHAARMESPDYARISSVRKANLHARGLVVGTVALVTVGPILAWTFPSVLSALVGIALGAWVIKLIPGRGLTEVAVATAVGLGTWWFGPYLLELIPRPPVWAFWLVGAVVVLSLGWAGRPQGKPLVADGKFATPAELVKPTADMVIDALCRIGVPGMTLSTADRVRDEIRVIAPGVATSAHGYTIEMELPPGITAEMVVGQRASLAGALRRDLGCVWPSGNEDRHPGYLRLFLSHKPMNTGKQPPWPLAKAKPVDTFEPIPLFTDEELHWVNLTLAGTHTAVGGASGFGKSVWLRQLACALAFDPRARLVVFDGKRSGDLDHIRKLAHAFHEGAEPDEIRGMIDELNGLVREYTRRSKFLKSLPVDERSPKVTSALATRYPKDLSPIFVICDEVQEGTEYGVKGNRDDKAIRDEFVALLTRLSRVGRSAGIFLILASQKPDANVIPSAIMGNCSIRVAFKVSEQTHNDQILGTSARRNGIDSTMFGARDRGMAWLKGGDAVDAQVVRSWSAMVDVALAVELADKAYELRRQRGLLTGEAAEDVEENADLLADIRDVMGTRPAMHLATLAEGLGQHRPQAWSAMSAETLGTRLREAGVRVGQVKVGNRNTSGVRREWLGEADRGDDGTTAVPVAGQ